MSDQFAAQQSRFIDVLEPRRLCYGSTDLILFPSDALTPFVPAIVTTSVTSKGTLVIKGTANADSIRVELAGKGVKVVANNNTEFIAGRIKRVLVEANAGDDHVDVSGYRRPATVAGGTGDDVLTCIRNQQLIGGAGDDKLIGTADFLASVDSSSENPSHLADATSSLMSGGLGNDTLVASGAPDSLIGGQGRDLLVASIRPVGSSGSTQTFDQLIQSLKDQQGVTLSGFEAYSIVPAEGVWDGGPTG